MTRQRRSFSTQFKSDAATLVVNQGYSIREASRSLGVGKSANLVLGYSAWAEAHRRNSRIKAPTADQRKIQELEAPISRLEREKAILERLPLS